MKHDLLAWPICVGVAIALVTLPPASVHAAMADEAHSAIKHKAHPEPKHKGPLKPHGAPADEYFGRQKLSILGVRNTVHDLNIRYDGSVQRSGMVITVGSNIEDAMTTWYKRYPGDLWLAHNAFQLVQIYMRVPTPEGRAHLTTMSDWIIRHYPHTFYERYLSHIRAVALAKDNESPMPASMKSVDSISSTPLPIASKPVASPALATPATNKTPDANRTPPAKDTDPS